MPIMKQAGLQVVELSWDFAVDGGSVGTHEITGRRGAARLPVGAIVVDCYFHNRGAVVGESGANVQVGDGEDDDFYVTVSSVESIPENYTDNVKNFDDNGLRTRTMQEAVTQQSPEERAEFISEYRMNCRYISNSDRGKIYLKITGNTVTSGQIAFFVVLINPAFFQVDG